MTASVAVDRSSSHACCKDNDADGGGGDKSGDGCSR